MKYLMLMAFVVAMIFVSSLESIVIPTQPSCIPRREKCNVQCSKDCCTKYCRNGMCIQHGDAVDDAGRENPCRHRECPRGQTCVVAQVQCVKAPCPGVGRCVNATEPRCRV